jgi:hypothetical protein
MALIDVLRPNASPPARFIADATRRVAVCELAGKTALDRDLSRLRDKTVLLATVSQLPTVLALIELDGLARRVVICTPRMRASTSSSPIPDDFHRTAWPACRSRSAAMV